MTRKELIEVLARHGGPDWPVVMNGGPMIGHTNVTAVFQGRSYDGVDCLVLS